MNTTTSTAATFAPNLSVEKMPAHWLMARLGKRVLRPGGVETTRWLLANAGIDRDADVIELAPGVGATASEILARQPRSYVGVERDADAAAHVERSIVGRGRAASVTRADASRVPLPDACANVVVGEAMLSMQPEAKKRAIVGEARRLLRDGGRYAIHELAVAPDAIDPARLRRIEEDLSRSIHVGVRIGTVPAWRRWLEDAGFEAAEIKTAPMRLLETSRVLHDEGPLRTARFLFNTLRTPGATRRLRDVRAVFREHEEHLCAIAIVARRR